MNNGFQSYRQVSSAQIDQGLKNYMIYIYQYMSGALALSGVLAYLVSTSPAMMSAIFGTPLQFIVMLAPLGIALFFGFRINQIELKTAQILFWSFAALMGVSLASIFMVYTGASIARAFFISSFTFFAMSLYGYATKRDLTSLGSFMIMGLIGIMIASIVNIFLKSSGLSFVISVLSVFIFIGLTAYDTQKIKQMYYMIGHADFNTARKVAIMGALSLYMDFINLFLSILRFVGERRD
jgi:hypothetical protein